jgi:hypothetical protein
VKNPAVKKNWRSPKGKNNGRSGIKVVESKWQSSPWRRQYLKITKSPCFTLPAVVDERAMK